MKSEQYHYAFMVQEGYSDSFHTCSHCYVACEWLIKNCGGFVHQAVLEEIEDHAVEYPYLSAELVPPMTTKPSPNAIEHDGALDGFISDEPPMACFKCNGSGYIEKSREQCCGNVTKSGECKAFCAVEEIYETECPICGGRGS